MNGAAINIVNIKDLEFTSGYDEGFEAGYRVCEQAYRYRAREHKRLKLEARQRRLYFLKQKAVGLLMLVLTGLGVVFLDGDATIAVLTVPISCLLLFSKEMCWTNRYYWEVKERKHNELSI